jgi:hypothetical protein
MNFGVFVEQGMQPNEITADGNDRPQSDVTSGGTDESSINLPSRLTSSSRRAGSGDGGPSNERRSSVATNDDAPGREAPQAAELGPDPAINNKNGVDGIDHMTSVSKVDETSQDPRISPATEATRQRNPEGNK